MDVLRFLFFAHLSTLKRIELFNVASKPNISYSMVCNIIYGQHRALFEFDYNFESQWVATESKVPNIKNFLLDPARSRDCYLVPRYMYYLLVLWAFLVLV